jgi:hypothetical protein
MDSKKKTSKNEKPIEGLVGFGEDDFVCSNQGNTIHFECFVPKKNNNELLEEISRGMAQVGVFDGIMK